MSDLKKAAQQALESAHIVGGQAKCDQAVAAVREALAAKGADQPCGAVLVRRDSREGGMFYSPDMIPDATEFKGRFGLLPVYIRPQHSESRSVPEFNHVAQRKLDSLLADGFEITGYSIQRADGDEIRRGFVTAGGMVGWSQPEWIGLTDEEIERNWQFLHDEEGNPPDQHDFARAIEAKLREKNGGGK